MNRVGSFRSVFEQYQVKKFQIRFDRQNHFSKYNGIINESSTSSCSSATETTNVYIYSDELTVKNSVASLHHWVTEMDTVSAINFLKPLTSLVKPDKGRTLSYVFRIHICLLRF